MENNEPKIVSSFIVTVNENGGMSFKDAGVEGQTPLAAADMADYIVSFGDTLKKYHEEERTRAIYREEAAEVIAQYIRAQKDLFASIEKEKKGGDDAEKNTPSVIT